MEYDLSQIRYYLNINILILLYDAFIFFLVYDVIAWGSTYQPVVILRKKAIVV